MKQGSAVFAGLMLLLSLLNIPDARAEAAPAKVTGVVPGPSQAEPAAPAITPDGTYKFADRGSLPLFLDVYLPPKDAGTLIGGKTKPAVLFVFGGGFVTGVRDNPNYLHWYKMLTDDGYPVVAIDYRLGMKDYKVGKGLLNLSKASAQFELSQQMGVEDVFAAVSWLAANDVGIDPFNMVLAGSSAGAIISLAAAWQLAGGTADGLPEGFSFKGIMSFAGAIISTKGAPKLKSEPVPILMLHGTADKAVAYNHVSLLGKGIWGSSYLARQIRKNGWKCCIWRFTGRTHDVAAYMRYLWPVEKEFLEQCCTLGVRMDVDAVVDDPSLPVWGDMSVDDIY